MQRFSHMTDAELKRALIGFASANYPYEHRKVALRAAAQLKRLEGQAYNQSDLTSVYTALLARLNVTMPTVPADIDAMDRADRVALGEALELAQWDYDTRTAALSFAFDHYGPPNSVPASGFLSAFATFFLATANTWRSARGLSNLS